LTIGIIAGAGAEMAVNGLQPAAMIDDNVVTKAGAIVAAEANCASAGGVDRCAKVLGDVDPGMETIWSSPVGSAEFLVSAEAPIERPVKAPGSKVAWVNRCAALIDLEMDMRAG